jgi:hypothetical protein
MEPESCMIARSSHYELTLVFATGKTQIHARKEGNEIDIGRGVTQEVVGENVSNRSPRDLRHGSNMHSPHLSSESTISSHSFSSAVRAESLPAR